MKNILKLNKRGIFFTILVLIILSLFLISYTFFSSSLQRKLIQKRIETMNSFLFSVEEDLSRQLFISGFRIIFLFEARILEGSGGPDSYITNVSLSFKEAFFNGTIEGETNEQIERLMDGATFENITSNINKKANKINLIINISSPNIEITQEDPWNIKVVLTANLTMTDLSGLASWNRAQTVITFIPIQGFDDPLYPIQSGSPENTVSIIKSQNGSFSTNDELIDHAENTYYISSTGAPSFLDRLEGKLTPNPNGIESLAVPKLSSSGSTSIVDHEYFIGTSGTYIGSPFPSYFIIDIGHTGIYRVT